MIDAFDVAPQFSDWLRTQAAMYSKEFPESAEQFSATAELIDRLAAKAPASEDSRDELDRECGRKWRENSSLESWFPLTAEELARLRAEVALLRTPPAPRSDDARRESAAWRCSCCGELLDELDSAWRWTGETWQHHHAGLGHMDAVNFGPPTAPREAAQDPFGYIVNRRARLLGEKFVAATNWENWKAGPDQHHSDTHIPLYTYPAPQQREGASEPIPLSYLLDLLPGSYYMDPTDGGDTPPLEQLRRMAADATLWRLKGESAPLRRVTDEDVDVAFRAWNGSVSPSRRVAMRAILESFRSRLSGESAP